MSIKASHSLTQINKVGSWIILDHTHTLAYLSCSKSHTSAHILHNEIFTSTCCICFLLLPQRINQHSTSCACAAVHGAETTALLSSSSSWRSSSYPTLCYDYSHQITVNQGCVCVVSDDMLPGLSRLQKGPRQHQQLSPYWWWWWWWCLFISMTARQTTLFASWATLTAD